jgi:tetratricopeptide (TPR) repeat protein
LPKEKTVPPGFQSVDETAHEKPIRRKRSETFPRRLSAGPGDLDRGETYGPTGLAIYDGKSLSFPAGPRFNSGDTVICNNQRYRVKVQTGHQRIFYVKTAGLLVLVLLAAVGISSFFSSPPIGSLSGVVFDSATGKIAPGVTVTLSDGSITATDAAGLYNFSGLGPGEYDVEVTSPGYKSQTQSVTREENRDAALPFALEPLFSAAVRKQDQKQETEPAKDKAKVAEYGTLELDVDFEDYIIYLNNKIVGKNIKKVSKISPGKHSVALEKNQYEDYRTEVDIKVRRTTTVSISLDDLKRKTTPRQRAKTRFAEGKDALDNGHYPAAIKSFNAALTELPEYPDARQYRGWAYRKSGNISAAAEDFKAAAGLYALTNRYLEAITCSNLLLEMYPERGEFYLMRGDYQTALGESKLAIDDYKKAVDRDDRSLAFRLALAEGYYRDRQFKDAAKEFEKARKMTDDPADVYVRLILSYMYAGKDKDLLKRYREFADIASPAKMERLRTDPEWQRVLQLIGPDEKYKKP